MNRNIERKEGGKSIKIWGTETVSSRRYKSKKGLKAITFKKCQLKEARKGNKEEEKGGWYW